MATFTKRGDLQWQVKVRRKGYRPVSKTFSTKAKGKQWARLVESEMDGGVYLSRTEAENTTFREALERYLIEITPTKKGAKQEGNRIRALMKHSISERIIANIRSVDIAVYRDARLQEGKSPITVNNELIIISHVFTTARKEWGLESLSNPVSNIRKPKLPPGRDRRLEGDEEDRLLTVAKYPLREMIILAIETAMRQGKIVGLQRSALNVRRRVLTLADTKSGEGRIVPLSTRAVATLRELPRRLDGLVFPSVAPGTVSHRFRKVCEAAGIENLRFHDLRHEATSRLFELGLKPMEVASVTGHKTLGMLKRYTHLRAEDIARKLG